MGIKEKNIEKFNLQREEVTLSTALVKTIVAFAIIFTTAPVVLFVVQKLFG